jgi:prepilin-type N-terminal cleavage/methylation domain-containing protein
MMHFQKQSGFTLVETLVAITILLIVIIGPMNILTSTTRSTSFASEQVVAFFLAQEGVELIQLERDNQLLADFAAGNTGQIWDGFTDTSASGNLEHCFAANGCGVVGDNAGNAISVIPCNSVDDCRLYLDSVSSDRARYSHDSDDSPTPYTRVIRLVQNGDEVQVVSEVTWRTGSLAAGQRARIETYLFDIYDTP